MMRKQLLAGGAILAALAGGWFAWDRQHAQPGEAPNSQGKQGGVAVTTTLALRQTQPIVLEANGYVASLNSVDIHPQISNVITRVHVKEGQFVKAGEVLFTLDERSDRANLLKAEAQLAKDQATLTSLEHQFTRQKELRRQGFIAQNALDIVKGQFESQQAALRQDQAAIEGERVSLDFNTLRAPISGRIGAINVYPGTLVQPGSGTLATITQLDPIAVSFTLPERELTSLLAAAKSGNVAIEAYLPNSSWKRTGRLSFIDNAVDSQSGTIRVKGLFANSDHGLWPGAYAGIRISVRELKDAVVIPLAAVVNAVDGTHLYTVSADATVQRRKIEILHSFDTRAAIKGLDGGERVVVDGTQNLRPGMLAREAGGNQTKSAADSKPAAK
ncbi:MAG: efflux RND transporter periplasmic adaptor subunit [Proteobacteria bacterium]|nr:efflux RND transporter periplasmic adaptor subunit [Pseudomonadota bacterium]